MGLISHDWVGIQNAYLKSLGAKLSRATWISSLIRNLCNTLTGVYGISKTIIYMPWKTSQKGNYISHQYKSLSTLKQRNTRTPQKMPITIKIKYSHSPLLPCLPISALDSNNLQRPQTISKNSQQDGKLSRYVSTPAQTDSLHLHSLIHDHLWSISNAHNCCRTWENP